MFKIYLDQLFCQTVCIVLCDSGASDPPSKRDKWVSNADFEIKHAFTL